MEAIRKWLGRVVEHPGGGRSAFFEAMGQRLDQPSDAVRWLEGAFASRDYLNYWIAVFAAYFGDSALVLEASLRSPDAYAIWAPSMAGVCRQPGFRELVRKLGLPEYWREFEWADFCRPAGPADFACE